MVHYVRSMLASVARSTGSDASDGHYRPCRGETSTAKCAPVAAPHVGASESIASRKAKFGVQRNARAYDNRPLDLHVVSAPSYSPACCLEIRGLNARVLLQAFGGCTELLADLLLGDRARFCCGQLVGAPSYSQA